MRGLAEELERRLADLRARGLHRQLRQLDSPQAPLVDWDGRRTLNFSSNDYLGLANHPALKEAAVRAIERFGAGSGASRLVCGSLRPHAELEATIANFKGAEAALAFATGYSAALGGITALLGREDVIILDRLAHASLVDGARLSGAKLRVFAHNDLSELEEILRWADERHGQAGLAATHAGGRRPRVLVVTESVFSMDGDAAPLRELVELKDRYGAWLLLDEAHATGLYGPSRRGLAEAAGVAERIEVQMGTLGKAIGAAGGYLCGTQTLVDYLLNRARSFMFSTAPPPAAVAAATAGLKLVQSAAGATLCAALWERVDQLRSLIAQSLHRADQGTQPFRSAILPLILGDEAKAAAAADQLRARDILLPAIRYPAVARGQARLRLTLSAAHRPEDVVALAAALAGIGLPAGRSACLV